MPAPKPPSPQSLKLQAECTKPPKPMRPPPPPEEDLFNPYELWQAFKRAHQSSQSVEGVGWMWIPSLRKLEGVSLT